MTETKQVALAKVEGQRGTAALQPTNYEGAIEVAKQLSDSGMVPKDLAGKPKDILAVMLYGSEFGLPVMHSLQNIYVVKGRPSMSTNMMVGLIHQSGLAKYFRCTKTTDDEATYETHRHGDPEPTALTFTYAQAERAKYTANPAWQNNRADMLRYRAASKLARMAYPDVVSGVYTPQEMADGFDDVEAEILPAAELVPEDQPIVKQEGETKAQALVREKRAQQAEAEAEEAVEAEIVDDLDAEIAEIIENHKDREPGEDPETEEDYEEEAEPAREEENLSDYLSLAQVDEINAAMREAYKGFGADKQRDKKIAMFLELDKFLESNPILTSKQPGGYRRLEIVPAKHFDLIMGWAVNTAIEVREGE